MIVNVMSYIRYIYVGYNMKFSAFLSDLYSQIWLKSSSV